MDYMGYFFSSRKVSYICSEGIYKMTEAAIQKRVQMEATRLGLRVLRNNRGQFYTIDCVKALIAAALSLNLQRIKEAIKQLRQVRAGLEADGSSDLIGWTPDGKFVALEIKTPEGKVSPEQQHFIDVVNSAGGFGAVIRDEKMLKKELDAWCRRVINV
jgi:hypothetical protein